MGLKESAIMGLMVMMSINVFSGMLNYVDIIGLPIKPFDNDQFYDVTNSTVILDPWLGEDKDFYDVSTGYGNWWYKTVPYIESFLYTLQAYDVPEFIYKPIHNIWRTVWFSFSLLVVVMGRDV